MNFQDIIREVYDGDNKVLKTSATVNSNSTVFIGTPTLYAVVNTGAAGDPKTYIGLVTATLDNSRGVSLSGNVTLSDAKTYIGLTTSTIGNTPTVFLGTPTLYAVVNTGAAGDPKTYIGLVTATLDNSRGVTFSGNVTLDAGSKTQIVGNLTLSDPKGFIGLVTVVGSLAPASGNVTLDAGSKTGIVGNVTISDSKGYIGLVTATLDNSRGVTFSGNVTLDPGSKTGIVGNVTLSDSKTYIGLVTATLGNGNPSVQSFGQFFPTLPSIASGGLGPVALDNFGRQQVKITADGNVFIGLVTVDIGTNKTISVAGNVTLSDSKTFIGLVTTQAADPKGFIGLTTSVNGQAWPDPKTFIGLVTVGNTVSTTFSGNVTLSDAKTYIGLVTATLDNSRGIGVVGNVTLSDSKTYIGLNTVTVGVGNRFIGLVTVVQSSSARTITGNLTLSDSKGFIGLATTVNGAGTQFIGLVTAWTRNAGSAKTLTPYSITLSTSSVVTIAVPTNAQSMYITNMVLSSDATVRVSIKSGVTYMTGNASLGISLNPGGGIVMTGAPDSPSWIGLPSGALVVEKFDMTATKANIGGSVITFTE